MQQSPSVRTEPGPTLVPPGEKIMTFGAAMTVVLHGAKVTRLEWADRETYLYLRAGILHLRKADGTEHKLVVSDGDLSGMDWVVV